VAALLVLAVAAGLLASDFHFLGDVLAGLYLGVAVAYGLTALIAV
jgi:membrane-associated phospholipid phosphatase